MEFCPTCGNMLQFELPYLDRPSRFFCSACPYVCHVNNRVKIKRKQRLVKKEIEPIISPDDMKNAPKTEEGLGCSTYFIAYYSCSGASVGPWSPISWFPRFMLLGLEPHFSSLLGLAHTFYVQ
ncbi:hypothetical protein LR48_Vigan08g105100 [Vigna angularis]|uniref:DNA-directed RNA polymerase II subunit RPB9-like zinc ribbon domain-containing protein n=1 Tax=Phaseolus angularis TaxID=3914 RepID=A0A0L9V6A6_PHAAN|nr:uncharacterized protein HKW66_Vig0145920 [Vigna angularis]KOM50224.1 hypothetical protein LR48_Vigan08g105100 [Vigna angularis]